MSTVLEKMKKRRKELGFKQNDMTLRIRISPQQYQKLESKVAFSSSLRRPDARLMNYFIRGDVIAKLFRGKLLYRPFDEGFIVPKDLPEAWITHVKHIGKGLPALQYLSRQLYRGVLSEKPSSKPMPPTSPSAIRTLKPAK